MNSFYILQFAIGVSTVVFSFIYGFSNDYESLGGYFFWSMICGLYVIYYALKEGKDDGIG